MTLLERIGRWFPSVGSYRLTTDIFCYEEPLFIVEVRGILFWHIVKTFHSKEWHQAYASAQELLDLLNKKFEQNGRNY